MQLIYIEYYNLFSFKKVRLDFTKLDLALFKGENGVGKSFFFDAIYWTLYGSLPRKKYKKIMRDVPQKQRIGWGKVGYINNNIEYKVTRRIGKGKSLKISVGGKLKKLRTQTLVQKKIIRTIGMDSKTFLNVAYFSQGDVGQFLNSSSSDRIKIIADILNLFAFDKAKKSVDKEMSEDELKVSNLKGKIEAYTQNLSDSDIRKMISERKMLKSSQKTFSDKLVAISHTVTNCRDKIDLHDQLSDLQDKYVEFEEELSSALDTYRKMISNSKARSKKIPKYELKLKKLKKENKPLEDLESEENKIDKLIRTNNDKISRMKANIETNTEEINSLENVVRMKGKRCETCNSVVTESNIKYINALSEKLKRQNANLTKKIEKLEDKNEISYNKLDLISNNKKKFNYIKNKILQIKAILKQYRQSDNELDELLAEREEISNKYKNKLLIIRKKIKNVKSDLKDYDGIDESDIENYEIEFDKIEDKLSSCEKKINLLDYKIDKYYDIKRRLKKLDEELSQINKYYEIRKFWSEAYPEIKIEMIKDVIPFIQAETNKYLSQIFPGKYIEFKLDPKKANNKLDLIIHDRDNKLSRVFEGFSGGQRNRMSMSVYLALNKLASMRSGKNINFLILDEKFASIDSKTRPIVIEMLKTEYKDRKIFAISHVNDIEKEFNQVIEFKIENGITKIKTELKNAA